MAANGDDETGPAPRELTPEQEQLVLRHRNLARFTARHEHNLYPFMELGELVGIGYLWLVEAAASYEAEKGDFIPFAKIRIRGAMRDEMRRRHPERMRRGHELDVKLHTEPGSRDADPLATIGAPPDLESVIDPCTTMGSRFMNAELRRAAVAKIDDLEPELRCCAREASARATARPRPPAARGA